MVGGNWKSLYKLLEYYWNKEIGYSDLYLPPPSQSSFDWTPFTSSTVESTVVHFLQRLSIDSNLTVLEKHSLWQQCSKSYDT